MTFEIYKDDENDWRWRLRHNSNGKIIADSGEGYENRSDCMHGIDLVKGSSNAQIKDA